MSGYWDHKTKPSTFVVLEEGKEIYRGGFADGYKLLNKRRNFVDALEYFFTNSVALSGS